MKKIFLLSALLASYGVVSACEICGCGNNNFQIGILPYFSKGFAGIRYTYSEYQSQLKDDPTQFSHDYYRSTELWSGLQFNKWQAMVFVPYIQSRKVSDDGTVVSSGIGDITLLANYKLISKTNLSRNEKVTLRHDLWVGGGIKLPTGTASVDVANPDFNIGDFNSQPGTGSIDYLANVTHNFSFNNSGVVTNATYRFNTANQQNYRFGNRFYGSMLYFHTFGKKELKLRPNAGANFQSNCINHFDGQAVDGSDGYVLNAVVGLNVARGKWGLLVQGFLPVAQDMYAGQTKLYSKAMAGFTYSF